jgi:hypothetical protein
MRARFAAVPATVVLGLGVMTGFAACGDDDETETVTATQAVTQTATQASPTVTETAPSTSGQGGAAGDFERCVQQTGNPDFCANPPPGE